MLQITEYDFFMKYIQTSEHYWLTNDYTNIQCLYKTIDYGTFYFIIMRRHFNTFLSLSNTLEWVHSVI